MENDEILKTLVQCLTVLELALRNPARTNLEDEKVLRIYRASIADVRYLCADAVRRACNDIMKTEDLFPTPATFRRFVISAAYSHHLDSLTRSLQGWVNCETEDGYFGLALPCRVRAGRLLPEGDTSGDGSPKPLALGPRSAKAKKVEKILRSRDRDSRVGGLKQLGR